MTQVTWGGVPCPVPTALGFGGVALASWVPAKAVQSPEQHTSWTWATESLAFRMISRIVAPVAMGVDKKKGFCGK